MFRIPSFPTMNEMLVALTIGFIFVIWTIMNLSSAEAYFSLPLNETVIMAMPSFKALIMPFSTIATSELLEV